MARKLMLSKLIPQKYGVGLETFLRKRYLEEKKTQYEIADELGCSPSAICGWFKKFNIQTYPNGSFTKGRKISARCVEIIRRTHTGKKVSLETRKKLSESRRGISPIGKSPRFTGKRYRGDGYIQVYLPNHPYASKDGYVMEHRVVMEKKLGRYLTPTEEVHHINHIRNDNRIDNLQLFKNKQEHMSFHMKQRYQERNKNNEQSVLSGEID